MIDTIKIFTMINKETYNKIHNKSIVKTSYSMDTGEIFYTITNDHLKGSYDTSLSVRVGDGAKYKFINTFYLEIEGSYHKILKGYNSHEGFYNLYSICKGLINLVSNSYNVVLPNISHWFLQRVDIAVCFDLQNQNNIKRYLENLHSCNYPRRELKNYSDYGGAGLYVPGTTTTLKIYNKYAEFIKHDKKRFKDCDTFNIDNYLDIIQGFLRFEIEIKKKKLEMLYNTKYIRVRNINYNELKQVWRDEFMKLLKYYDNELTIVREREQVKNRLYTFYGETKGKNLYDFYCSLIIDGLLVVKDNMSKPSYYRKIKLLKDVGIDFSQKLDIIDSNFFIDFNPFVFEEVV